MTNPFRRGAAASLDRLMAERGCRMVRYADDFVILTRSREEADAALTLVAAWVAENGLTLHPEKTRVGDCRQPGEGFDFLGCRFEAGRRDVRLKSFQRLRDTIREKTRRTRGQSLEFVIADLNRTLQVGSATSSTPSPSHLRSSMP